MPVSRNKRKPHNKSRFPNLLKAELCAFANDVEAKQELLELLKMFYIGAAKSQIGIAMALDKDGKEVPVLVGIERTLHGNDHIYPIAKVLDASAISDFCLPDGMGNYVNPS